MQLPFPMFVGGIIDLDKNWALDIVANAGFREYSELVQHMGISAVIYNHCVCLQLMGISGLIYNHLRICPAERGIRIRE
jgi:hypothetical protein